MNKRLAREVVLLSLPCLVFAGVIVWKNGGEQLWRQKMASRLEMKAVFLYRYGPTGGQNAWNDDDFEMLAYVKLHDPLHRSGGIVRDWKYEKIVTQDGVPLKPQPSITPALTGQFGTSDTYKGEKVSSLAWSFDLDRVPLSKGELTLRTRWKLPDGRFQPFSAVVRPAWFCRPAREAKLQSARWLPNDEGVEIKVKVSGKAAQMKATLDASELAFWQQPPSDDPTTYKYAGRHLLFRWSPHFESNDGRYNSYKARDAFVWAKCRRAFKSRKSSMERVPVETFLSGFKPSISSEAPQRDGDIWTFVYRFHDLSHEPRTQRFVTDIGIPGDGFLRVQVPVPAR